MDPRKQFRGPVCFGLLVIACAARGGLSTALLPLALIRHRRAPEGA